MKNKILFLAVMFCLSAGIVGGFTQDQEWQPENIPVRQDKGKISLDIKGMDMVDALKMLATQAGINLVIGKNVSGRVTLFLKDVDAWDAFEIALLANELVYEKKDNIVNVMTTKDYELKYGEPFETNKQIDFVQLKYAKSADLARSLVQMKTNFGKVVADENSNSLVLIDTPQKIAEMKIFINNADIPIQTRFFSLNYAQADKLQPKIQEILTKNVGYLKIDERTNKIAVTDYAAKLDEAANLIKAFDAKPRQVLIDAQIIQLSPSDNFQMGVDWEYWIKKYFDIKLSLPVGTTQRLIFGTPNNTPTSPGDYKGIIDLLRTIGDTKVLASPRIIVLNNQEAKIHVGVRDAYITSTTSQAGTGTAITSQAVNFVDTGTQLYVTPTISAEGFIVMKLKPEISEATRTKILSEGKETEVPIVTTSETETTVVVKDGVTLVIGGLKKDKREKTVKKVPILGSIPGLGLLFSSTSDNITQSDLVILLTPHIISGESSYADFSEVKPKEGVVVKWVDGDIVTEKFSPPVSGRASAISQKLDVAGKLELRRQYYNLVTDRINLLASSGKVAGIKGRVEVFFSLNAKGQLLDIPRVIFSTNYELNDLAIKNVEAASPFPPFTDGIDRAKEDFRIAFDYK